MLHGIAVWPFLEQPAGKDAVPFIVAGFLNLELDKGASLRRVFPWGCLFAGAQANDSGADSQGLPWFHRKIAGQAVAFIEQADDRHAFGHWCAGQ